MKRIVFVAVLLAAACGEAPLPNEPVEFQLAMSVVKTSTYDTQPFEVFAFAPCGNGGLGELIHLIGEMSTSSQTVVGPDGQLHSHTHIRMHDVRGRGLSSGHAYKDVSTTNHSLTISSAFVSTLVVNYHLIGHGRAPDYHVREVSHVTQNPAGDIIVDRIDTSATCR